MSALVILIVFFLSGAAALVYQVVWQRLLVFFGGADVHAVTIIVSAFMGGLGFGHLAGGYLADRLSVAGRLRAFIACEMAVAAFALVSVPLYYDVLYQQLGEWRLPAALLAGVVFVVTLWPTFFMGMSLPLLATALTHPMHHPARWVSLLYGCNTLGAAVGSFGATAVLFRSFDFVTSIRLGAAISASCGIAALLVMPSLLRAAARAPSHSQSSGAGPGLPTADHDAVTVGSERRFATEQRFTLTTWALVYALSGFVALSLEIVWFRLLGVILKSNAFTFGHLLAVYLGGIGLGALLGNSARARRWRPATTFFLLQTAIPIVAVTLLLLFTGVVSSLPDSTLWQYLGRYEPVSREELSGDPQLLLLLYVFVPLALIGPPTLMMGLSFGALQRAVQTDIALLGRRIGWLQTANILGSMAGALVTGVWLLDWVGTTGTLRLLLVAALLFAVFAARAASGASGWRAPALLAAALVIVAVITPSSSGLWTRLHGTGTPGAIHAEDGSGVSFLKTDAVDGRTAVFANGLGQSYLPYGAIHTALGALPAFLHPRPVTIAVIGLGSGDTVYAVGGRPETERIDSIEIIAPQLATLRTLAAVQPYPALRMLLQDARIEHALTDGRLLLRQSTRRYDLIEADALRPTSAYAGNLYSVEYFSLLRARLARGGMAVTWAPTPRVVASFVSAFPHVVLLGEIAVGSETPITVDPAAVMRRLQDPFTRDYYERGGIDIARVLAPHLARTPQVFDPTFDRSRLTDLNHDLHPKDEFAVPYREP